MLSNMNQIIKKGERYFNAVNYISLLFKKRVNFKEAVKMASKRYNIPYLDIEGVYKIIFLEGGIESILSK